MFANAESVATWVNDPDPKRILSGRREIRVTIPDR